jgi:hypothetical protein
MSKIRVPVAVKERQLTFAAFSFLGGITIKKVKTSSKGRVCKFPHCRQVLSIYNHEAYCHVHLSQGAHDKKLRVN